MDHGFCAVPVRLLALERGCDLLRHALARGLQARLEQRVLGGEVIEERLLPDPHRARDLVQARARVALAAERADGLLDQRVAPLLSARPGHAVTSTPGACRGGGSDAFPPTYASTKAPTDPPTAASRRPPPGVAPPTTRCGPRRTAPPRPAASAARASDASRPRPGTAAFRTERGSEAVPASATSDPLASPGTRRRWRSARPACSSRSPTETSHGGSAGASRPASGCLRGTR